MSYCFHCWSSTVLAPSLVPRLSYFCEKQREPGICMSGVKGRKAHGFTCEGID